MSHTEKVVESYSRHLRWFVPLAVGLTGVGYQIAVGELHPSIPGAYLEFAADIVLFGLVSPIVVFYGWSVLWRTRQHKVEAERRAGRAERLLVALDGVCPEAIVVLDDRGRIARWNDRAEALFGYARQQVAGQSFAEILVGKRATETDWRGFLHMVRNQGAAERFESTLRKHNGEPLKVEASGRALLDSEGRSDGVVVILREVSRRTHSAELIEGLNHRLSAKAAELAPPNDDHERADSAQAEMLLFVAHEVRLPLSNILGGAERIQGECAAPTPSCCQNVQLIGDQVSRLDGLVREVLDAARVESGAWTLYREPTPTQAIVRQALEQFSLRCHDRLINVPFSQDRITVVDADRDRIVSVLCNLLSNAVKYSPPRTAIDIDWLADAEFATLRVRDRGHGLPEDSLGRVFEKFYRVHDADSAGANGHGLGLYICWQIVSAHGGRIWAENHPAGGAVFCFTLPIAE